MAETHMCSKEIHSCKYSNNISGVYLVCDYINKTGHRRGCDPEKCDKYKPGLERKQGKLWET